MTQWITYDTFVRTPALASYTHHRSNPCQADQEHDADDSSSSNMNERSSPYGSSAASLTEESSSDGLCNGH